MNSKSYHRKAYDIYVFFNSTQWIKSNGKNFELILEMIDQNYSIV